jgi:VanZ family protein
LVSKNIVTSKRFLEYSFLFLLILFLFIGGPQLIDQRSFQNFWDFGHVILFALLSSKVLRDSKWLGSKKLSIQFSTIIGLTFILGSLIEIIQLYIGRTYEFIDVWRSMVGSLLAIVFSQKITIFKSNFIKAARIFVLLLLLIATWPLIKSLTDEIQAKIDFPVIADFENPFELEKWYGHCYATVNEEFVFHGKKSLKAELLTVKYSGFSINYFPTDCQGYSTIKFNLYLPTADSLRLTCRIHDVEHNNKYNDRFNKSFYIKQGWNEIAFDLLDVINAPENRTMDITNMKNFAVFAISITERKTIYFDYLRLE